MPNHLEEICAYLAGEGFEDFIIERFSSLWLAGRHSRAWKLIHRDVCGAKLANRDGRCLARPVEGKTDCGGGVSGNAFAHWLSVSPVVIERARLLDPNLDHCGPDALWRHLCRLGFRDAGEAARAAREFARIQECAWARAPDFRPPDAGPITVEDQAELDGIRVPGSAAPTGDAHRADFLASFVSIDDFDEHALPISADSTTECEDLP